MCFAAIASAADERPNILFCISDDQSWQHTGANGDPVVELYDIVKDPGQMNNVAGDPRYASIRKQLDKQLRDHLFKTDDPRLTGGPVLWDYYPYYGRLKTHEGTKKREKDWAVAPIPSELTKPDTPPETHDET